MTKLSLALLALSVAAAPLAFAESKTYDAGTFNEIDARGALTVIYNAAETRSVSVEQVDGDFSDLNVRLKADTLIFSRVSLEGNKGWRRNVSVNNRNGEMIVKVNGKIKPSYIITVTGPELEAVSVSSSSELTANNLQEDAFFAKASSSADVNLNGAVQSLRLDASSSADIEAGDLSSTNVDIEASSSADIEARADGGMLKIDSSSSSDVEVAGGSLQSVSIDSSSSSDVTVTGSCTSLDVDASSSADIDASGLSCQTGRLVASSGSEIEADVSDSLYARASSGADIEIAGSVDEIDIRESSGGSISL